MRHSHWLLRLLKLHVVVNDKEIYECREKEPVIIPCREDSIKLVVTNGFHSSRVLQLRRQPGMRFFEVEGFIDNVQLLTGIAIMLFFGMIYIFTGLHFFLFFANIPLLVMLYLLYVRRRHFILIHQLKSPGTLRSH
ncbi:MAG: hypothetical protein U0X40_05205 [Ferruginibacter sp.]